MVFIVIHSFVSVSSFTYLLYFIFCGTNWAEQEEPSDTGPQHLVYFLNVFVLGKGNTLWTGPEGMSLGIFRFVYLLFPHTVDLYISLHFNTLGAIASVTTLISVTLSLISALLTLWGLSNASSLLFIMQGRLGSLASALWTLNDSVSPERPLLLSTFQQLIISLPGQLKCHFLRGSYSGNSI